MNIAIYCKDKKSWSYKARAAAIDVVGPKSVPELLLSRTDAPTELIKYSTMVAHLSDGQWKTITGNPLPAVRLIIRVSSVGLGGMNFESPHRLSENGPWILHLIEPSEDVTAARWKEIFTAVKSLKSEEHDLPPALIAIFEPYSEMRCALRLLCDAWVMNKGIEAQIHAGVTINAPVKPEQWFQPFQEKPTEAAAAKIAKQMGRAESVSEEFLQRVAQLSDAKGQKDKGQVNWATFEQPIRKLQAALEAVIR